MDRGRQRKLGRTVALAAFLTLGSATTELLLAAAHLYELPLPARFEEPRRITLDLAASDGAVSPCEAGPRRTWSNCLRCPAT